MVSCPQIQMNTRMPIGIEDFKKAREGYYLVDKTNFIKELIDDHAAVTLITRPRRFGKTLTMSMLDYFFSVEHSNCAFLFDGLSIQKAGSFYMEKQGKYPVLFLTLKDIKDLGWTQMRNFIGKVIGNIFSAHDYLLKSDNVQMQLKEQFVRVMNQKADQGDLELSLSLLLKVMEQYYGKSVILLLDEYDAPIQSAWEHGFYDECISFMRKFLGSALKTNSSLDFAVLTGVLRIAKESIFSDLNNLEVCSIFSENYSDIFGFTANEVKKMSSDLRMEDAFPVLKSWYDGYRFGNSEIYNPWSVLNFFKKKEAGDYWINTSSNWIIAAMISSDAKGYDEYLRSLVTGKTVTVTVREGVVYTDIGKNKDDLYTMLATTGYLTVKNKHRVPGGILAEMAIPNREIRDVYQFEILRRMDQYIPQSDLYRMFDALLSGDANVFSGILSAYIEQMVSSFDAGNKESFYHGFVLGMTALLVPRYEVSSNRESGYGRFDLALFPKDIAQAGVIMEFKTAPSESALVQMTEEALVQIKEKDYMAAFRKRGISTVWKYGIAFSGKKCCIKKA